MFRIPLHITEHELRMITDYAIIVAGGSGTRMKASLPKQFLELAGKPVLVHTLEKFHRFNPTMKLILVLPEEYIQFWEDLRRTIGFKIEHTVVPGGKERFFSVKNALDTIEEGSCIVGIHDAVRPLVSMKTLESAYHTARERSTAVPVIAIHDSIREVDELGNNHAVNRRSFRIIQTPQCFELNILKKAYEVMYHPGFTDDASVVEASGVKIHLVEGNKANIKITTPEDLRMVESLLAE